MKYSIIVPLAKKDKRYLKRCLLSLQDQDYENYEVIVVCDGFKHELPIEDDRFSIYSTDKQHGASYVRNFGAKKAKGKLYLFFDADCVLFPGMLSLVKDKFDKENCDFVYGGYRYNHATLSVYPSRPFDPWLIESMNYISTMSPMKKQVFERVGGFNEDLPYFQDWDFFLRAVKEHHFKGYFLKDFMFQTEVPNRKSISGGLTHKWREKCLRLERLHDLPSRDICVTTLSAPYQAAERAKVLNARYVGAHSGSNLVQLPSQFDFGAKAVILQGFFPMAVEDHMSVFPKDSLKIINWIGTDVWQLRNKFTWESIKLIKERYLSQIDLQFCNSRVLQEELKELGIHAEVVYQPLTEEIKAPPKAPHKTISAYFSKGHPVHNEFFLKDLAASMPDYNFVFFGTGLNNKQSGNVRYVGWRPIQEAIDMTTLHLRITSHDGFPHTPIYMLMGGRKVICNFPLEYADYIPDVPCEASWEAMKTTLINRIRESIDKPLAYDVKECQDYYKDLCNSHRYKEIMLSRINNYKGKKDAETKLCSTNKEQCSVSC